MIPRSCTFGLLALGLAIVTQCRAVDPGTPGPDEPPVLPDQAEYTLTETPAGLETEIRFDYHNVTDRTISLPNCRGGFGLHLEKREAGRWVRAWEPVQLMCLSPPIEIAPGDAHRHALRVSGARPGGDAYPQFQVGEVPGTYRIVITSAYWGYDHDGPPWGEEIPLGARVSAPFELRIE